MHLKDSLDPDFLRRQWLAQRVLWVAMLVVVLATLAGAFGGGLLGHASVAVENDGAVFTLDHLRIERYEHESTFYVRVHAPAAQGEELMVVLSRSLADGIGVASTMPAADGGGVGARGVRYTFAVEDWSEPLVVAFTYRPERGGWNEDGLVVEAGQGLSQELVMQRFVYP